MSHAESLFFPRPLRNHQIDAINRFANRKEAALFWEPGCGKTSAAIGWYRLKCLKDNETLKTVIISPVATLYNWVDEFKFNAPEELQKDILVPYMRTRRTKYTGAERAEKINTTDCKIIILNGESLDNEEVVKAIRRFRAKCLILDESHRFKSHNSSRSESLRSIADFIEYRMILTGTPILNSYLDLWAQFRILDRGKTLGESYWTYRATYFYDKNASWKSHPKYFADWQPRPEIDVTLTEKIADISSRLDKKDCLKLPELLNEVRYVEMGKDQAAAYYQMETQLVAEVSRGVCSAKNALDQVTRLLQILCGYLPTKDEMIKAERIAYFKENPRLQALKDLLSELTPKHKVIVWSTYQDSYVQIRKVLEDLGLEWAEIVGGTKNRDEELKRFEHDPACRVMLSNAQAGGVGVNMVAASYAIYFSRTYSLGDRLQSEARNHRGGSEQHAEIVHIDLVVRGTLDEEVLGALLRKESFSENILTKLQAKR